MSLIPTKASAAYRAGTLLQTLVGYGILVGRHPRSFLGVRASTEAEQTLNAVLGGYPSNHRYRVQGQRLVPGFQLYERLRKVTRLWPDNLESMLDVGCCKGFYALSAALKPSCRLSVGIDVDDGFIAASQQVSDHLGLVNTRFFKETLDHLADRPEANGGPFQTVLVLGTYHYLFWGSSKSSHCFRSHEAILSRLAELAGEQVIVSGRFELDRLPRGLKPTAMAASEARDYTTEHFVAHAGKVFDVKKAGFLGTYPLFVLKKK